MGATGEPGILLCVWVSQRARERWVGGGGGGGRREGGRRGRGGGGTWSKLTIKFLIMSDCITEVTFLLLISLYNPLYMYG